MQFSCKKCGSCCNNRFLCIYFFEKNLLNELKARFELNFKLEPFRFFFDLTNKIIINVIFRVNVKPCPFFANSCMIQSEKFISCQKYPINTYIDLGFFSLLGFKKLYFDIDNECTFIKSSENFWIFLKSQKLENVFPTEYEANLKDYKTWSDIHKKIKYYKKFKDLDIIIDYKFKKKKPNLYKRYLETWKHLNFNEYIEWIKLRSE